MLAVAALGLIGYFGRSADQLHMPQSVVLGGTAETPEDDPSIAPAVISDTAPGEAGELSWLQRLTSSHDYHALITNAAPVALRGDAEAQTIILKALHTCHFTLATVNAGNASTGAQIFSIPDDLLNRARGVRDRCAKLDANLPLDIDGMPEGVDASDIPFWVRLADETGAPLGVALEALHRASVLHSDTNSEKHDLPKDLADIERRLRHVVRAADPQLASLIGVTIGLLSDTLGSKKTYPQHDDEVRAAAWILYGCSMSDCLDPGLPPMWSPCPSRQGSGCDPLYAIQQEMREQLGDIRYSQAEVLSRDIEASISRHAWGELDLSLRREQ